MIQKIIEGLCDDDDGDNVVLELRESLERSYDGDNGEELGAGVETNIYVTEAGPVLVCPCSQRLMRISESTVTWECRSIAY